MSGEKRKDSEGACSNADDGEMMQESTEDDSEKALEAAIQSLNDTLCEGSDLPMEDFTKMSLDAVVSHTLKTIARFKKTSLKAKSVERKNRRLRRQMRDLLDGLARSECPEDICIVRQRQAVITSRERKDLDADCAEDMSDCNSNV